MSLEEHRSTRLHVSMNMVSLWKRQAKHIRDITLGTHRICRKDRHFRCKPLSDPLSQTEDQTSSGDI